MRSARRGICEAFGRLFTYLWHVVAVLRDVWSCTGPDKSFLTQDEDLSSASWGRKEVGAFSAFLESFFKFFVSNILQLGKLGYSRISPFWDLLRNNASFHLLARIFNNWKNWKNLIGDTRACDLRIWDIRGEEEVSPFKCKLFKRGTSLRIFPIFIFDVPVSWFPAYFGTENWIRNADFTTVHKFCFII